MISKSRIKVLRTVRSWMGSCAMVVMLTACGDGSGTTGNGFSDGPAGTGAAVIHLIWPDDIGGRTSRETLPPESNICDDYAIDTIACYVYNAAGIIVRSQSWDCSRHKGTIDQVPAGPSMSLMLEALVAGSVSFRGQSESFTIMPSETTIVNGVPMSYIGDDATPPQIDLTAPVDGATSVSLNTGISVTFSEDVVATTVLPALTLNDGTGPVPGTVTYDSTSHTATFVADGDLSESTVYTLTIASDIRDLAGNRMGADHSWEFTTAAIDAPVVTTLTATLVTEDAARLNGRINPNGFASNYYFEYGTPDITVGTTTPMQDVGSGTTDLPVFFDINNLNTNTTYRFRTVATNAHGTTHGTYQNFTTDMVWGNWAMTLEDTYITMGQDIEIFQPTSDGGYILTGYSPSSAIDGADFDIKLLKLDANGNIDWEITYGEDSGESPYSVQQTSDGGYVVAGTAVGQNTHSQDIWILKLGPDGSSQWTKTYGGNERDWPSSVKQTSDGGYIVSGNTQSFDAKVFDIWILKLNPDGAITWQKTYQRELGDFSSTIHQTSDGGYIVGARTDLSGDSSQKFDIWIVKLHADGEVEWQKKYGVLDHNRFVEIQSTPDGKYFVAGTTVSFGGNDSDIWVAKLDGAGSILWQKRYGKDKEDVANSFSQTSDGGLILSGSTQSYSAGGDDLWILKLNADGGIEWQKTYGGTQTNYGGSVLATTNGYIVAARTWPFDTGQTLGGIWLLKIEPDGTLGCDFGVASHVVPDVTDAKASAFSDYSVIPTSILGEARAIAGKVSTTDINLQCP